MDINFTAGDSGRVWIHGVPIEEVEKYGPSEAMSAEGFNGPHSFKTADILIGRVTITLVSEHLL